MDGKFQHMGLEPLVFAHFNPDMGMAAPERDRVAKGLYGASTGILERAPLLFEERVLAVGRHQEEKPVVADVVQASRARSLPSRPRPLRDPYPVPLDELLIDRQGIFAAWNPALDEEEISVREIRDRHLLDEAFDAGRFGVINGGRTVHRRQVEKVWIV